MGTWVVYGFWDVTQLRDVFNAVAALMSSGSYTNIMLSMMMLGGVAVVGGAMARVRGEEPFIWMVAMVIIYEALVVPKVTVVIQDAANIEAPQTVANVPMGLAFLASTITDIGEWAATTYETLFTVPSNLDFTQRGLDFGEAALSDAVNSVVLDPNYSTDLLNYVQNCVAPDLLDGSKNLTTLMTTEDVWSYMGNPNPARFVYLVEQNAVVACPVAYNFLNGLMPNEVNNALNQVAREAYPDLVQNNAPPAVLNAYLLGDLPAAANTIMQVTSANATNMIRQSMMVNLWQRVPQSLSSAVNDSVGAQVAEGTSQAMASSMAASFSGAQMASQALPGLHNSLEIFIIGVFPIVMVLVVMGGKNSGKMLMGYIIALLWVELWPMGYAIVNYIVVSGAFGTGGIGAAMSGGLTGPPTLTGLSILNAIPVQQALLHGQAAAGQYVLFVPIATFAIVSGSAYIFSNTVPTLLGSMMGAAQSSGGQAGLGNVSMGQTNYDNLTAMNRTEAQTNSRGKVAIGGTQGQGLDYISSNMSTYTNAHGKVTTGTDGTVIGQANLSNFGMGLSGGTQTGYSSTSQSGSQTTAATGTDVGVTQGQTARYTQQDSANYQRAWQKAVGSDLSTLREYAAGYLAGEGRRAGQTASTGTQNTLGEEAKTHSKLGVDAYVGRSANESQNATELGTGNRSPGAGAIPGQPPHAMGEPPAGLSKHDIGDITRTMTPQQWMAKLAAGIDQSAATTDSLKWTAEHGGTSSIGTNQEQSQKILMDAAKKASSNVRDSGERAAGLSYMADLGRSFGWSQSRIARELSQVSASDTTTGTRGNTLGANANLEQAAVQYMMSQNPGMSAMQATETLMAMNPAQREATAAATQGWLADSPQGQAWLHAQNVGSPLTQAQVQAIGQTQTANLQAQGQGQTLQHAAANRAEARSHQPFSATSMPNDQAVISDYNQMAQANWKAYMGSADGAHYQVGAQMVASAMMAKQHGLLPELKAAFAFGHGLTSPDQAKQMIDEAAQYNPTLRAQLAHLGSLPQGPSPSQVKATAEMVAVNYQKAEQAKQLDMGEKFLEQGEGK